MTSIGSSAFYRCSSLTSITIDEENTVYTDGDCNAIIKISSGALIQGCNGTRNLPSIVTSIGNSAFDGCTGLTSITIPEGVTSIQNYAFRDCSSLTSITIPDGMTSIGYGGFYGCSGLTDITIPASVTSIRSSAFHNCTSLANVYYAGTSAQWAAITVDTGNDPLTSATKHYNSTGA